MKMSPPPMSAAGAAAAALAVLLLLSSAGVLDGLSIPDSGLESPLGVREGFAFVTKPSTSSFFIAQQTMAVSSGLFQPRVIKVSLCVFQLFPKLLFPLLLSLLFWDPDDTTPENDASLEKAVDFLINPAIAVPRLYMISGVVRRD